ncbi:AraC family transcriptional regulator [Hydrogenophaga sp.]|uniref:AraC family transcriptional regulator n=1 Tax=Hydrogenophaga sp. TaxID=1904254 RepID=UPI00271F8D08|nr:AraC family transcriptional regulator [Hydrogenophaga sp.]MDO8903581.1 AraC family transcriptional regulator [Hydrogenophaga sp.]
MSLAKSASTRFPPAVLARWKFTGFDASVTTVLPDGCSDLILHVDARGRQGWHVSPLTDVVMEVAGGAGEWWLGYRMQPGTTIDAASLLNSAQAVWRQSGGLILACTDPFDEHADLEAALLAVIDAHARLDPRSQEALHALAHAPTVGKAAQSLGVSERSLERLTSRATGKPPRFWRALARVRRAARMLGAEQPLADIAAEHGYADQAHFSRDCLRWLGQSPASLRRSPHRLASLAEVGYG